VKSVCHFTLKPLPGRYARHKSSACAQTFFLHRWLTCARKCTDSHPTCMSPRRLCVAQILTFAPAAPRSILLLQFDLDHSGRYLVTPSHGSSGHRQAASRAEDEAPANGVLRIYDLWGQGAAVAGEVSCPSPWISGVSLHPTQVRAFLAPLTRSLPASRALMHARTHARTHARMHARTCTRRARALWPGFAGAAHVCVWGGGGGRGRDDRQRVRERE
jgi:hypothetical protein